jgi:hypothetical protein
MTASISKANSCCDLHLYMQGHIQKVRDSERLETKDNILSVT